MRGISTLGMSTSLVFFCSGKSEDKCRSLGMKEEVEYDRSWHNKKKIPHHLGWRVVINNLIPSVVNRTVGNRSNPIELQSFD